MVQGKLIIWPPALSTPYKQKIESSDVAYWYKTCRCKNTDILAEVQQFGIAKAKRLVVAFGLIRRAIKVKTEYQLR